jgi:hypothetical protein
MAIYLFLTQYVCNIKCKKKNIGGTSEKMLKQSLWMQQEFSEFVIIIIIIIIIIIVIGYWICVQKTEIWLPGYSNDYPKTWQFPRYSGKVII